LSVQVALYALATAVATWWALAHWWEPDWAPVLPSLLLAAVAALIARRVLVAPARLFAWDGSVWRLGPPQGQLGGDGQTGQVALMLDLGPWMLLRFRPAAAAGTRWPRASWIALARSDGAAAWPALRVALHAAQPDQPGQARQKASPPA
jgi:hypothetical protein